METINAYLKDKKSAYDRLFVRACVYKTIEPTVEALMAFWEASTNTSIHSNLDINYEYDAAWNIHIVLTKNMSLKGPEVEAFINQVFNVDGIVWPCTEYFDVNNKIARWRFTIDQGRGTANPNICIVINFGKSVKCKKVETGEFVPVYKIVCEDA